MAKTAPLPSVQVNYPVGRTMIKSGDIISFFASHEEGVIKRLVTQSILFFTGSRIYHTGVALWITTDTGERRLMLCEAVGVGRRLVNLSRFHHHKMEVHSVPKELDQKAIEAYLMDGIGTGYGFWTLIAIAIREFIGVKPPSSSRVQVCSETAARTWRAGGMEFEQTILSPGKLRNVLSEKGVPPSFVINPDSGN
jgi:hypothetical protein